MTAAEMMPLLKAWRLLLRHSDAIAAELMGVGMKVEAPIVQAVFNLQSAYTEQLAARLNDSLCSLEWFWIENDLGAAALEAQASNWPKPRRMRTLRDLAQLIEGAHQ